MLSRQGIEASARQHRGVLAGRDREAREEVVTDHALNHDSHNLPLTPYRIDQRCFKGNPTDDLATVLRRANKRQLCDIARSNDFVRYSKLRKEELINALPTSADFSGAFIYWYVGYLGESALRHLKRILDASAWVKVPFDQAVRSDVLCEIMFPFRLLFRTPAGYVNTIPRAFVESLETANWEELFIEVSIIGRVTSTLTNALAFRGIVEGREALAELLPHRPWPVRNIGA